MCDICSNHHINLDMNNLLKGKKGIIFGALNSDSIAWKVAEQCHQQGAQIVLTNAPMAMRLGDINGLADAINAPVVPADATSIEEIENLFTKSMEHFGGQIDFVLHSIGMSVNVRKKRPYTDLNYNFLTKGWDVSAVSFHKVLQTAYKMDAIADWGSVLGLTYMAAQRTFPDYNDMAENKAYLESIARSFGYHYGLKNKVRVNTISQSPTMTTAGSGVKGFDGFMAFAEKMSPLGNATAEDCADYCVAMFSDLTRRVTMQNLYNDGGFSLMGVSQEVLEQFMNSED